MKLKQTARKPTFGIRPASTTFRSLDRVRGQFTLELAAYNLIGLPGLLGAAP